MDREEYERYLEEIKQRGREERERKKETAVYKPSRMNVTRMPFGCWLWIAAVIGAVIYLSSRGC